MQGSTLSAFIDTCDNCVTNALIGANKSTSSTFNEEGNVMPFLESSENNETDFLVFPNPFTDVINFKYALKQDSPVSLKIYTVTGKEVTTLVQEQRLTEGTYHVQFNGSRLPAGMYLYRLVTGDTIKTGKIILKKTN